jgi:formate hydrogenlyase subunit 3/multisubunit Na+/H+ antiporter MnhD subunit
MTASGVLLVPALVLPVTGMLLALLAGGRHARSVILLILLANVGVVWGIAAGIWQTGQSVTYHLGGWSPPLGIELQADGLSAAMMAVTALVSLAAGLYAPRGFWFPVAQENRESRMSFVFWYLLSATVAAMNLVFLAQDLFTLYVGLELVAFAGVPMVALSGSAGTLRAALRYLIFALMGSMFYLLGAVLLYGRYGTLDISLLAGLVEPGPTLWLILALMTVGLAAKTALFPLHIWLPPAHAGAPPAASALLSALVVKASFFLVVRLWFDLVPGLPAPPASQVLGAMGAGAIVFGGILALRQARLKLLIAYSTIAQLGYLFLAFPLAFGMDVQPNEALTGGMFQAMAHAFAKASMFMAAGLIAEAIGHDRIADMGGLGRVLPVTCLAFGIAALSLIGVPPTGGFVAKWLLLEAAAMSGQWWWAALLILGGFLAGGYMFRVIVPALALDVAPPIVVAPVSGFREGVVLALALAALALGLLPGATTEFLSLGRPTPAGVSIP